jgi:hypothetical protein
MVAFMQIASERRFHLLVPPFFLRSGFNWCWMHQFEVEKRTREGTNAWTGMGNEMVGKSIDGVLSIIRTLFLHMDWSSSR